MVGLRGNAVIGQAGGPTAIINQTLIGVVNGLLGSGSDFTGTIFGTHHGSEGMRDWNVEVLNNIPVLRWEKIGNTPAAYLGGTRDKPDKDYCEQMFDQFKKNNVRYVFYIGGNDSANTAYIIDTMAKDAKYELFIFHLAKTVDNDIRKGDHMPGFPTAAKYNIYALAGLIVDAASLPSIVVAEVMGRHAGYLTSSAVLVNDVLEEGKVDPLIYIPEIAVPSLDVIAEQALAKFEKHGIALVVYSEGISDKNGNEYKKQIEKLEQDARGQVRLSASPLLLMKLQELFLRKVSKKIRIVPHMLGYLQRCDPSVISEVDRKEAFELGIFAAKVALEGNYNTGSIGIDAARDPSYKAWLVRWDLKDVEGEARKMDKTYSGDNIGAINTNEYAAYLRPLLGSLERKLILNPKLVK